MKLAIKKNDQPKAEKCLQDIVGKISKPDLGRWNRASPSLKQLLDEVFQVSLVLNCAEPCCCVNADGLCV